MPNEDDIIRLLFIGLSGYAYPHTRVRCYHFAKVLDAYPEIRTKVLSFRDHLCPERSEVDMFDHIRDWDKMKLVARAIERILREDSRTLLYVQKAHYHSAAPYLMHRLFKRKYIFDYDDYDVELSVFFRRGIWNRLFFGTKRWDVITHRMAARAVSCVVSSHFLFDFLKQFNPRTYLVQTGVDVTHFQPGERFEDRVNEKTVFLWTGIVWGDEIFESVCQVLDAFKRVASVCPNVSLQIVGGGQRMGEVESRVRSECGSLDIQFLGWKAPTDMPAILNQADVGLLPFARDSIWTRSKSPTKLFEYMASGLPVVANDIGEVRHVLDDGLNGFLVSGVDSFADRMISLAKSPDLRLAIGGAARKKAVEDYSLPQLGSKLHAMLMALRNDGVI